MIRQSIKRKLEHDHNFLMKVASELGDIFRELREVKARVVRLERRLGRETKGT